MRFILGTNKLVLAFSLIIAVVFLIMITKGGTSESIGGNASKDNVLEDKVTPKESEVMGDSEAIEKDVEETIVLGSENREDSSSESKEVPIEGIQNDDEIVPVSVVPQEIKGTSSIDQETCVVLKGENTFYADPAAQVIKKERELRLLGNHEDAALLREIACFPHSTWLLGTNDWSKTMKKVESVVEDAARLGQIPVFVLYNEPRHDGALWGSGLSFEKYEEWITDIATTIGSYEAWIILEPDALATAASYSELDRVVRTQEIERAVQKLEEGPNVRVYIDIGHSDWLAVDEAVELLTKAGISIAHGFSLNVANFRETEHEVAYGVEVALRLPGKLFVIDIARNGNGPHPNAEWCNAPGRAIGERPSLTNENGLLDALLWVKPAGESDGTCNGGPDAGIFWLEYALDLVE